jgi:uncharacterized membrane protein YoaK (UPF0700 family)
VIAVRSARLALNKAATAGHPRPQWPAAVAGVLTLGTGALDVTTLTHLGGVFASVMTGNLAMNGLALVRFDTALFTHTAVGLSGYVLGVAAGTWITGRGKSDGALWPGSASTALAVQLGVLVAFGGGWEATHGAPAGSAQLALLTAAAGSMGLQGAAMRGLGVTVTTTYLTGTLTGLVAGLTGSPRARTDPAAVAALIGAVAGAATGGVLLAVWPVAVPLLMLIPVAIVLAAAPYHRRGDLSASRPTGKPTHAVVQAYSAVGVR